MKRMKGKFPSARSRSSVRVPRDMHRGRRTIQIAAALMLAAALTVACGLFLSGGGDAAAPQIRITEVVTSNSASLYDAAGGSPDWIELHNPSGSEVSLDGYCILIGDGTKRRCTLGGVSIAAGGYTIVYAADATPDGTPCTGFSLPRSGCTLRLMDDAGVMLHTVSVPALFTDISYAADERGHFGHCLSPTPGAPNSAELTSFDALGARAQAASLVITEAMPAPSEGSAWVELYNAGSADAFLGVFYLADSETVSGLHRFPDTTLAPGEYAIIHAPVSDGGLGVPFRLDAGDRGVYLFDVTGALRSALTWSLPPGADTAVVAADTYTKHATPGAPNSPDVFSLADRAVMDETDAVRLSEALADNAHSLKSPSGARCAWVEVCNQSGSAASLAGYYLSDDARNPLKWAFPGETLAPGGHAVVFLSGAGEGMEASFRLAADESALYLTDAATMRTDTLALPAAGMPDISVGRAQDGSPCCYAYSTPGAANDESFPAPSDAQQRRARGVVISEACAADAESDWIELYNGSGETIDLSGWYLSDDADNPRRWQIPSLTIAADGYAVIAANSVAADAAPFGIAIPGETLTLTRSDGALIDAMDTGPQRTGVSSGRIAGDAALSRVFFAQPTPGAPNSGEHFESYAAAPAFSETRLYHAEAFSLSLTSATAGASIHYTLDGSAPGRNSALYSKPIPISANTVVRAIAVAPGLLPSETATATFLFGEPHTVPVVCLSGAPSEMNDLFNKANRHHKPEHGGNMEYYEADGTLGICFTAGIKSKGRSSLGYDQKSVTICLRKEYGRSEISYPFFDGGGVTTFAELTLRNGGQDYFGSRLRDSFVHQLAQGMDVTSIRTRIVAVYVNGKYWGVYDLEEEHAEGYFEAYYGLSYDDIDMVDRNNTVKQGSAAGYLEARNAARSWNLADDAVFAEFAKLVDVNACMDYLIVNTFFGNGDVMNQRFWHARDGSTGWQPLLFDLDWCMRFNSAYRDTFSRYFSSGGSAAGNGTITNMDIFHGLKKNAAWRKAFINRFIEVSYSYFDTDRVLALFDATITEMEPEMARHIARWRTHRSTDAWLRETDALRSALEKRRDIALRDMARAFGLSDAELKARIDVFTSAH